MTDFLGYLKDPHPLPHTILPFEEARSSPKEGRQRARIALLLQGIYIFPNGNTYDGEWSNDMKEGYRTHV